MFHSGNRLIRRAFDALVCFGIVAVPTALRAQATPFNDSLLGRVRASLPPPTLGMKELIQLAAQWLLARPSLYGIPASLPFLHLGETIYRRPLPVRGLSAVAARTLAETLPLVERETEVRRANAKRLLARCGPGVRPVRAPASAEPGYLRLPLLTASTTRNAAASAAARSLGIVPGYPQALCDLAGFAERVVNGSDAFPGARLLAEHLITFPTHSLLDEGDLARLESRLAQA